MAIGSIFYALFSFFLSEWESIYKAIRKLLPFLGRKQNRGVYEILEYETTLQLNATGETATFLKRQKVRFLQDNVISFEDYAWGEGEIFSGYHCSPGVVVDRYQIGDRWNILISLRESKSRGDLEEFFIQSTFVNSFLKPEEWQQVEIRHHTKYLKMIVVFPQERFCKRAIVQRRRYHQSIELDKEHFGTLPDGRQIVTWEAKDIEPLEVYTLRWEW